MKRSAPLERSGFLKRTGKLPVMSPRRRKESAIYTKLRREFLTGNATCWAWMRLGGDGEYGLMMDIWGSDWQRAQPSEDVHHTAGRHGGNYLNVSTFMAVSRKAHDWIGAHPKEAEARGWIVRTKTANPIS